MDRALVQPRGFCAGLVRAIDIGGRALGLYGPPVYVLHEIGHNRQVVSDLETVPEGAVAKSSALGVSCGVRHRAAHQGLRAVGAARPLVTRVHLQARRGHRRGDKTGRRPSSLPLRPPPSSRRRRSRPPREPIPGQRHQNRSPV